MNNLESKLKQVQSFVVYEPDTGNLFVLKNIKRRLIPDQEGMINTSIEKIKLKLKYNKFVYYVKTGILIKDNQVIFHKDLDTSNFKFNNLTPITKEQNFKIQESLKNLNGNLKINLHKQDRFSYVLEYKENGRTKKEVISDIVSAKKRIEKLKLKFTKYLGKFVIST